MSVSPLAPLVVLGGLAVLYLAACFLLDTVEWLLGLRR